MCSVSHRTSDVVFIIALALVSLAAVPATLVEAYVPGAKLKSYKKGEQVNFNVNSIRSLSTLFPQDYYKLPFCQPETIRLESESIGEIIWGDRLQNSLYSVNMLENSNCTILPSCDIVKNTEAVRNKIDAFEKAINRGYRGYMSIDNLPVFNNNTEPYFGMCKEGTPKDQLYRSLRGYALGVSSRCTGGLTLINNHLAFRIKYHAENQGSGKEEDERYIVVGLSATPYSVAHADQSSCSHEFSPTLLTTPLSTKDVRENKTVLWTYSVEWEPSNMVWATRWDEYLHSSLAGSAPSTHLLYMGTSLILVFITASAFTMVLLRALHKDFNRYNSDDPEDLQEETGWKLIHADVFRPPDRASLLSILAGNGYQVLFMVTGVMLFALLGFLSPSRRGALLTAVIVLSVFMAIVAGYVCGLLLKYFNVKEWKYIFLCGAAFPGSVCGVYLVADIINLAHRSTTSVPFGTLFLIFSIWAFVSIPLTVLGATFAFNQEPMTNPVRVGRLAREIPLQGSLNSPIFLFTVPPLFPLCTLIMELHFAMQGLWAGQVYYVFGFFSVACFMWTLVAALVTVFQLYYVLCYENHRWWWIAFMLPGCMGLHVFIYAVYFFFSQLSISTFGSTVLYFLYMGVISTAYGLAAGAVGLTAGLLFVRKIYGSIKVD